MSREALFGAAISIVSLLIGALLNHLTSSAQHRRQQLAEKAKRRAEKFEELIAILYEHKQWLGTIRGIRLLGYNRDETMSPMPRAEAIVTAYFPVFRKQIAELDGKSDAYDLWLSQRANLRLKGMPIRDVADGWLDAYRPYSLGFHELTKALHDFAEREFR